MLTAAESKPTTKYLVMAVNGHQHDDEEPVAWPREMWQEVGVLDVPQRTNRASVVEQAKDLVAELIDAAHETVRIRVVPVSELTEASVGLEAQPRLIATIVEPVAATGSVEP